VELVTPLVPDNSAAPPARLASSVQSAAEAVPPLSFIKTLFSVSVIVASSTREHDNESRFPDPFATNPIFQVAPGPIKPEPQLLTITCLQLRSVGADVLMNLLVSVQVIAFPASASTKTRESPAAITELDASSQTQLLVE